MPKRDEATTYEVACAMPRCGFKTTGWPTKKAAESRHAEHMQEHETGEPMPELYLVNNDPHPDWASAKKGAK